MNAHIQRTDVGHMSSRTMSTFYNSEQAAMDKLNTMGEITGGVSRWTFTIGDVVHKGVTCAGILARMTK